MAALHLGLDGFEVVIEDLRNLHVVVEAVVDVGTDADFVPGYSFSTALASGWPCCAAGFLRAAHGNEVVLALFSAHLALSLSQSLFWAGRFKPGLW